jgi:hypothetical protein
MGVVDLRPQGNHGITVWALTWIPGHSHFMRTQAHEPASAVACGGIALFQHVKQDKAAGRRIECLEVEVKLVCTPSKPKARGWLPDQDGAGHVVGVGIATSANRAA